MQIRSLQKKRQRLFKKLNTLTMMVPGSFVHRMKKCGRRYCWCHTKGGHPAYQLTYRHQGKTITIHIPEQHVKMFEEGVKEYSKAKQIIDQITQINLQIYRMRFRRSKS